MSGDSGDRSKTKKGFSGKEESLLDKESFNLRTFYVEIINNHSRTCALSEYQITDQTP